MQPRPCCALAHMLRTWLVACCTHADRDVPKQASSLMEFYDIWVARDTDGNLFLKQEPYVTDPYSISRIALGLPFPVKCCWNGMVVLNTAPFLRHGVRIRCLQRLACHALHPCS